MSEGYVGLIILGGAVWLICAYMAATVAGQRHRRPLTWGIIGIFFGPIALFAVYLMPPGHVPSAEHGTTGSLQAGGSGHAHQTPTQADLYEVPKHKR